MEKYRPKTKLVQKQEFPNGVKISDGTRNTTKSLIRLSECVSSLNPEYLKESYRKSPEYVEKLDKLD